MDRKAVSSTKRARIVLDERGISSIKRLNSVKSFHLVFTGKRKIYSFYGGNYAFLMTNITSHYFCIVFFTLQIIFLLEYLIFITFNKIMNII